MSAARRLGAAARRGVSVVRSGGMAWGLVVTRILVPGALAPWNARYGSFSQGQDFGVQRARHGHALSQAARAGLVSALRGQARALAGNGEIGRASCRGRVE